MPSLRPSQQRPPAPRAAAPRRPPAAAAAAAQPSGVGSARWLWRQALVMGSASAVLGPLCDGLHSAHGVLRYAHPVALAFPEGDYLKGLLVRRSA